MSDTLDNDADDAYGISPDPVVREAHKRFQRCLEWEAIARSRWLSDYRFANGDSDNAYQWPDTIYRARTTQDQPALTISKVRQHNLQIINDAKQKKSGIKYRPVGDGATVQAAEIFEGIVRHIQDVSNASMHRGQAIEFQVQAGLGFTRITTDYEHDRTFDQEIYIRSVNDPNSCYLDPDCKELDGSDARFAFIFSDRSREVVEREYPELKHKLTVSNAVDSSTVGWLRKDTIREAEYYVVEEEKDELIAAADGTTALRSQINAKILRAWEDEAEAKGEELRKRDVITKKLRWYKIVGSQVVEKKTPAGKTIPIIPWIGEQTVIDNILDRKGHTRALKDAQRMLNYNRSASVEFGALQSKTPYMGPSRAVDGYETYWETANTENHSFLPYNDIDENGQPIAPPVRQEPPKSAPVFLEGAQAAERDMMIASGQYEAELGAPGNETSGRAINERQRQGDRATYHFIDNQAISIRREGQILLELIPEVYDTARVKRLLGEDGSEDHVQIDPDCQGACAAGPDEGMIIFNPGIGTYAVVSDVGPDYATQRQEAFSAIVQVITQAPGLLDKIGDLLFKMADFPLADEIAERLKPGMAPEAQAAVATLQQQLRQTNTLLGEAMQALSEERLKVKAKNSDNTIKAFEADTGRLNVIKDMIPLDPADMQALIHETIRQSLQDNLGPIVGELMKANDVEHSLEGPPGATGSLPTAAPTTGDPMAALRGGLHQ